MNAVLIEQKIERYNKPPLVKQHVVELDKAIFTCHSITRESDSDRGKGILRGIVVDNHSKFDLFDCGVVGSRFHEVLLDDLPADTKAKICSAVDMKQVAKSALYLYSVMCCGDDYRYQDYWDFCRDHPEAYRDVLEAQRKKDESYINASLPVITFSAVRCRFGKSWYPVLIQPGAFIAFGRNRTTLTNAHVKFPIFAPPGISHAYMNLQYRKLKAIYKAKLKENVA